MVTGISPAEPVGDAVRCLARHRLEPAVEALRHSSEAELDEVVYDVRKRCKRVRALLRVVRDGIGEDVYRRDNRALRDAARALSPLRDAAVLIEVHDEVVRAAGMPVAGFRTTLVERHDEMCRQLVEGDTLRSVGQGLATVVGRIEAWPVDTVGWDALGTGIERVYRRGRKAMAAAYDDPGTETFHRWRKRVKYLRHQLAFLEDVWPEVIGGSAKAARTLADVLGDAHDLAVLGHTLAAEVAPNGESDALAEFLLARRRDLRARARPIGLRLYAEKPSRFVARLGRYWEAADSPVRAA